MINFKYPLGLLALIGVPILIIIYILKRKYTESTVSSTYIWRLSERFLKNRIPISKLRSLISLMLQILTVIVLALTIAHPIIVLPNAANEYCIILDGSASMSIKQNNKTRFELAKEEVDDILSTSLEGSNYTIIYVSDSVRYICYQETDTDKIMELVDNLSLQSLSFGCENALAYAQECFNNNTSIKTILVTDKNYNCENVELINVGEEITNYAISETSCIINSSKLNIISNVISYTHDTTLNVECYVNDKLIETKELEVTKLENKEIVFTYDSLNYSQIKVVIKENDSLSEDNVDIIYNIKEQHNNTALLVSDYPFYIESMLKTLGNVSVSVISTESYTDDMRGYGLYIFDAYSPSTVPNDGAVWLFGCESSINKSGFSVRDEILLPEGGMLSLSEGKTNLFKALASNVFGEEIYVNKYIKYGLQRNFTPILYYGSDPVLFAGTNEYNQRQVVFAFDIHNSNIALKADYAQLITNFVEYSFPTIIEYDTYFAGDTIKLNVLSNCTAIRVDSPNGNVSYLDISETITEYMFRETGTYKITVIIGEDVKEFDIYVKFPTNEANQIEETLAFVLNGEATNIYSDALYTKLIIFFICLAIIFVIDWMVYCYEQYQLR